MCKRSGYLDIEVVTLELACYLESVFYFKHLKSMNVMTSYRLLNPVIALNDNLMLLTRDMLHAFTPCMDNDVFFSFFLSFFLSYAFHNVSVFFLIFI
jgi:hypothetical protein